MAKKIFEIVEKEYIVYKTSRVRAESEKEALELYKDDPGMYEYDRDHDDCGEITSVIDITAKEISYLEQQINAYQQNIDSIKINNNSENRARLELRKAQLNVKLQRYKAQLEELKGD